MRTTIQLPDALEESIEHFAQGRSRSAALAEMVSAYCDLYEITRATLNNFLNIQEAWAIMDVVNSWLVYPARTAKFLAASLEDAVKWEGLVEKWFEGDKSKVQNLIKRLNGLSYFESWVLVNTFKRVWEKYPSKAWTNAEFVECMEKEYGLKLKNNME